MLKYSFINWVVGKAVYVYVYIYIYKMKRSMMNVEKNILYEQINKLLCPSEVAPLVR